MPARNLRKAKNGGNVFSFDNLSVNLLGVIGDRGQVKIKRMERLKLALKPISKGLILTTTA